MRTRIIIVTLILSLSTIASGKEVTKSFPVDDIQILKISAQDERAVIKTPDGKMKIIKVGDPVGDQGKVLEISSNRVVIEEKKNQETEKVIIRLIDGKQKTERLRKIGEKPAPILAPAENDNNITKQFKKLH